MESCGLDEVKEVSTIVLFLDVLLILLNPFSFCAFVASDEVQKNKSLFVQ